MTGAELKALDRDRIAGVDLVITSYGSLLRVPALLAMPWRLAILDEAQAIKTPGAKQTRAAKQIDARCAHRAQRHAGREPPRRSLVDLRLPQPGAAGIGEGVLDVHETARVAAAQPVRAAARAGAAVHPAAAEDRQVRHRRPAGQDRGEGLLPTDAQTSGALSAGGG